MMRRGPLAGMAIVAAGVVAIDFASKRLAALAVRGGDIALARGLRLTIIDNELLLGGFSLGGATRSVNCALLALLVALMALVARDLARVDRAAPGMLGLLAGAAIGNAIDLVSRGGGAVDFLALDRGAGSEIAFNLADLAVLAGLALCARTAWRVLGAWRAERAPRPALAPLAMRHALEVELPRALYADGVRARRPAGERAAGGDAIVGDRPPAPPEARA